MVKSQQPSTRIRIKQQAIAKFFQIRYITQKFNCVRLLCVTSQKGLTTLSGLLSHRARLVTVAPLYHATCGLVITGYIQFALHQFNVHEFSSGHQVLLFYSSTGILVRASYPTGHAHQRRHASRDKIPYVRTRAAQVSAKQYNKQLPELN